MTWLKKDPFLGALIFAVALTVGFEGWLLWRTRSDASNALTGLEQKKREREDLQHRIPSPTDETGRVIAGELAVASARLSEAIASVSKPRGRKDVSLSVNSIDAYFEIARFVETERAAAKRLNIAIKPDEHFSFTSHTREGPDASILPTVLTQRAAVGKLLDALFAAGPAALIAIQRERPDTILQRDRPGKAGPEKHVRAKPEQRREEPVDFFDPAQSISLRVPGKIETSAFKVEFSGATRVLRDFLNALASSETPFFVRSVEVEPIAEVRKASIASGASSGSIPIVTDSLSRFRVMIELLESTGETEGVRR